MASIDKLTQILVQFQSFSVSIPVSGVSPSQDSSINRNIILQVCVGLGKTFLQKVVTCQIEFASALAMISRKIKDSKSTWRFISESSWHPIQQKCNQYERMDLDTVCD